MNDRELLEMAAKAAGVLHVDYSGVDYDGSQGLVLIDDNGRHRHAWNPLEDDGDALMLVAQLKMSIDFMDGSVWRRNADHSLILEYFGGDHDPCYRRCIIRAAAEIGKSMEGK